MRDANLPLRVDSETQVHITLSAEKWDAFCRALDEPPRVIPAVRKLLTEPSVFEQQPDGDSR